MKTLSDALESLRERSTDKTQWEAQFINLPSAKNCKQVYKFAIGESVVATGKGAIKAGVKFSITQRHKVNGYCQYYGAGVWNKQDDIEGA